MTQSRALISRLLAFGSGPAASGSDRMRPRQAGMERADAPDVFTVDLFDAGMHDPRLRGILCPEPERGQEKVGITQQFLDNADTYAARYGAEAHRWLKQAVTATDAVRRRPGMTVLDMGCGAGTHTVQPCLALFENCRIVATDLSPDLLRLLRRQVEQDGLQSRVTCVCTDAMNDYFKPECFDIVVGSAILHHLLDPLRALRAAYRALVPGGVALFYEPFEGLGVLRVVFDLILERAEREKLPLVPAVARFLAGMSLDYATRADPDKSAEHFRHMDDKWLFTGEWLASVVTNVGFSQPVIVPYASHAHLFREYTTSLLRLGADWRPDALPDWAWEMVDCFDNGFSATMKRALPLEATVILMKPGA
jgi:ubiquinone/menaquinone biosynthesis C-methylase UbiE